MWIYIANRKKYTSLLPEEIQEKVVQEARYQFLKRGIAKTEMKQIANTVGIGRTTLYRYYPQKEQLAFIVALNLIDELLDFPIKNGKQKTGYERLHSFCSQFIKNVTESLEVVNFFSEFDNLFISDYPDLQEAHDYEKRMKKNVENVADIIKEGQLDGSISLIEEPQLLATILINTVMGLTQRTVARDMHYRKEHGEEGRVIVQNAIGHLLRTIRIS